VKEVERKVVAQGGKETRRLPLSPLCPMPDKLLDLRCDLFYRAGNPILEMRDASAKVYDE